MNARIESYVYFCVAGTPIALYSARIVGEEIDHTLIAGVDALRRLE